MGMRSSNKSSRRASRRARRRACGRTCAGTSFIVRTNLAIGACIVPISLASSSSRDGSAASAAISFGDITWPGIAPPAITNLLVALGEVVQDLRDGHRIGADAVRQRTDHLVGQRGERRIGDGPAHERVLDHPEIHARSARLRAKLRHRGDRQAPVFRHDDRLRAGDLLRDFRDYRLLLFQVETHSHPCLRECRVGDCATTFADSATRPVRPAHVLPVTARSGNPVRGHHLRWVRVRSEDRYQRYCRPRHLDPLFQALAPAVFDGPRAPLPPRAFPQNLDSASCRRRRRRHSNVVYAFAADCAKPVVSTRTPAPIVLETLTLRR